MYDVLNFRKNFHDTRLTGPYIAYKYTPGMVPVCYLEVLFQTELRLIKVIQSVLILSTYTNKIYKHKQILGWLGQLL